jgi:poly-beta-hydroxyalkanoate depolymerase
MELLKNVDQIKDYVDASMMPVYGGKLNLKSMISMIFHSRRS